MKNLLIISLVLLLCASVYATPVGRSNIATAVADVQTDTTALIQLAADQLGQINNPGNVFYCDSAAGGSGTGVDWTNAVTTIKAAALKCASDNGDVLLVAPAHAETLTAADAVDITRTGLRIYGLGNGENRPTLTYTANGEFAIGADDVEVHGINFIAGNAVVHAIDVEAGMENFVINDCHFQTTTVNTDEFIDAIDIAAGSDNGKITNCQFEAGAASAVSAITNVGSDYVEISGNTIIGDYSTACIVDVTTKSLWVIIKDNILVNGDTAGALNAVAAISLKSDTSALILDNKVLCDMTEAGSIVAAAGYTIGNVYTGTIGSGTALEAGKSYVRMMTMAAADDDDLFDISGGSILITNLIFYTTTDCDGTNTWTIIIDADDGQNVEFTDAVDVAAVNDGDRIVFSDANPAALTILAQTANVGSASLMSGWYCEEGMLEVTNDDSAQAGVFNVYMTFIPLEEGVTVTSQ